MISSHFQLGAREFSVPTFVYVTVPENSGSDHLIYSRTNLIDLECFAHTG